MSNRKERILRAIEDSWRTFLEEQGVRFHGAKDVGFCPFHDDQRSPSFSVYVSEDTGRHHFKCHAGCGGGNLIDFYMQRHGLVFRDAIEELGNRFGIEKSKGVRDYERIRKGLPPGEPTAVFVYEDQEKTPRFRVLRYDTDQGKRFIQQRPDGRGGWTNGLAWKDENEVVHRIEKFPYRIPEWIDGEFVALVEGEGCVHALEKLGIPATTTPGGSNSWQKEYAPLFAGKKVAGFPDNDDPGRSYIDQAFHDLQEHAAELRLIELPGLPEKGDVVDWIAAGGTVEELQRMAVEAPVWTPRLEPGDNCHPKPVRERVKRHSAAYGVDVHTLVPETGWLQDYLCFAEKYTDAPEIFHVGCAYTVFGAAMARRAWYFLWGQDIYLNAYSVLIGPSTTSRKSTAIRLGKWVLEYAKPEAIWPQEFSYEGFIEVLKDRPQGILCYSELASLLALFGRSYSEGAKALLIDLFDSPKKFERRLVKKEIQVEDPCASILAGSDESWLETMLGHTGTRGGFLARLLLFIATADDKTRWMSIPPSPSSEEPEILGSRLKEISEISGRLRLDDEAFKLWEEWLRSHEDQLDHMTHRDVIGPAIGRLNVYALKLAGMNALSSRRSLEVRRADMECALRTVEICKANVIRFVRELAPTRDSQALKKLRNMIAGNPGITRRELLRAMTMRLKDFDEVMTTVLAQGDIVAEEGDRKNQIRYFPAGEEEGAEA